MNDFEKKIIEYANKLGKPLSLTTQEFTILANMIVDGYSVEDYLFAKGKCLKEGWIEYK